MIFVTVGTHEEGLDRLIKEIDRLKEHGIIKEQVFIQKGYSKYIPKFCDYKDMIDIEEMNRLAEESRIIITHGGPGSIMLAFQNNKIPVVIPRQKCFNEHVDDHQVLFTQHLEKEGKIFAIYDINKLEDTIINYENYMVSKNCDYISQTKYFTQTLEKLIDDLFL